MAKHTGREGGAVLRRGSGFTTQSLRGFVAPFLQPRLSFSLCLLSTDNVSLCLCPLHTHKHYLHISFSPPTFFVLMLTSSICPHHTLHPFIQVCNIISLSVIFPPPISSIVITVPSVEIHRKDKGGAMC